LSHTVISVENVSKYYCLGLIGGGTLHGDFERWWARVRGRPDPLLKIGQEERGNRESEYIWALRDVSFEVKEGEVLGIIGRNGAGKSTLLKILSRVTAPTSGQVKIKGRVASLLEVGTGFHPELTGRENIYLNGAILGMKKAEIDRKFDQIVAFSEVEKFIDTPVKRYSSGMYVRLAFAVAAHLEPEILLVDEVLAVGDAGFQKKCLGKMGDVAREGRTVLFVSHNMGAVRQLCNRGIYLKSGRVHKIGDITSIIESYMHTHSDTQKFMAQFSEPTNKPACILKAAVTCPHKSPEELFDINDQIQIHVEYILYEKMSGVNVGLVIAREGIPVFTSFDIDVEKHLFISREAGRYRTRIQIPSHLLKAGMYTVTIGLGHSGIGVVDQKIDGLIFDISDASEDTTHKGYAASRAGVLALCLPWNTELL
jgi:lipopolysaccharide transport system ATP-binding protein